MLDGKMCSTHWNMAEDFRRDFPEVELKEENMICNCDRIYTSGGAYSFTNLLIYLVEMLAGREISIMASKAFMIDYDRNRQTVYSVFTGQKKHEDETILKVQEYLEKKHGESITLESLAARFGIGKRSLERRFKAATNNTVREYLQRVRIESAKRFIETGHLTIQEITVKVGYTDGNSFRETFKRYTGTTPQSYKQKYSQMRAA
jgi:transcriptional regulator GlxA family with amidase domain